MPTYQYVKAHTNPPSKFKQAKKRYSRRLIHILPNILIVVGATAVTTVIYPMLSYQMNTAQKAYTQTAAPISEDNLNQIKSIALKNNPSNPATPVQAYQAPEKAHAPAVVDNIDYTKASNWFPDANLSDIKITHVDQTAEYNVSIPKIDVQDMRVVIGGDDLDKYLIHYDGTALPGQYGNPVIFGHSVLPLFNNPENFMSVFTKLPTLEVDDEIFVDYDGIRYKYLVESYHEVQPTDIEVLEQHYDRQTITLITCVPPGTTLRRGVIQAHLVQY